MAPDRAAVGSVDLGCRRHSEAGGLNLTKCDSCDTGEAGACDRDGVPAEPPVGLKLVTVGGTFSFFRVPAGPVFVVTETSPVMAVGGTTAVMKSSLMTLKLVARSELDCGCSGESVAQDIDRPRRRSRIVLHDDEPRVRCAAQGVDGTTAGAAALRGDSVQRSLGALAKRHPVVAAIGCARQVAWLGERAGLRDHIEDAVVVGTAGSGQAIEVAFRGSE